MGLIPQRRGLAYKFAMLIASLAIIVVMATCAVFIVSQKNLIMERTRTESISLAETVGAALANAVVLKDYAFIIEHCMLVVRSRQDLEYIVVIKIDGSSLIHQEGGWRDEVLDDRTSKNMEMIHETVFFRHHSILAGEEVLEVALPITITDAKWGVIRLGFSVKPLKRAVSAMYSNAVKIGVFSLGIALLGTLLLTPVISRPIIQLTRAARRISAGDLKQRVLISSRDEIGELAEAFNKMMHDLDRTIAAEKDKAAELAETAADLQQALQTLKETQAKVIQSGRLASIGELAAGVAHEMNNPLSAVLTYAILLSEKVTEFPEELRSQLGEFPDRLEKIRVAAERCKAIAENLLTFSRQSQGEQARVSVQELMDKALVLIGVRFQKAKIKIIQDVPEKLWVWGNSGQLQQVVTNLCLNALQAMEAHGELRITASAEGGMTRLEMSDTGAGIPAEHLGKIFDPFFTTKSLGGGTGLGLSIVYGIITRHHGEITVDSQLGKGTTFTIKLPVSAGEETG